VGGAQGRPPTPAAAPPRRRDAMSAVAKWNHSKAATLNAVNLPSPSSLLRASSQDIRQESALKTAANSVNEPLNAYASSLRREKKLMKSVGRLGVGGWLLQLFLPVFVEKS